MVHDPNQEQGGTLVINVPEVGDRRLGLLLPKTLATSFPLYAAAGPVWSLDQIIASLKTRIPASKRFGDEWIKDQNGRGACAGYAAASALERAFWRRTGKRTIFSGDGIYAAVNGGRDRGSLLEDNMEWLRDHGIPLEKDVPRHEYIKSRIPASAYETAKRFRGFECYAIRTEMELASAVAADLDVVVAVHAGNGGRSPDGLIDWSNGVGNHSVVIDDIRYRNNILEFETPNSWGLNWGQRGRGWLQWRRHLSNPVQHHMFYAIRSTLDDPHGNNPPPVKI